MYQVIYQIDYIENSSQKIEVYQNIALCRNKEDIENTTDDIIDRLEKCHEK